MSLTYYIKTFGCQMNVYDSERIASILESLGYQCVSNPNEASVVILNTCSVREKPEHKVSSYIGKVVSNRKKTGLPEKIGVMGCVAQQEGENLIKANKSIDFVLGTDNLIHLSEVLSRTYMGERVSQTDWDKSDFSIDPFTRYNSVSSLVTIMKGCNNYCSYCIVPYVRGKEKSREAAEILDEVHSLVQSGVKEITLLGQNVNSYRGSKTYRFASLLSDVAKIRGLLRLRFMTSHPKDFNSDIIDVISENPNICSYIHLPVQSGSDRILHRMNRNYTKQEYLDKIFLAKEKIKGASFSSDFIVGFPSETEEDFMQTMDVVSQVRYENIFVFNYSVRSGTTAAFLKDDVEPQVKLERLQALNALQEDISRDYFASLIGTTCKVLVEGPSRKNPDVYTGRSISNRIVNFASTAKLETGCEIDVLITEAKRNSLFGSYELVNV